MRFSPEMFERVKSGEFIGSNAPNGRVTVVPGWHLNKTNSVYGNSIRGPYRWYQDTADSNTHYEVPNIQSISWDRSNDQDVASCDITLYNMWHDGNAQAPEISGQLGRPGYFWPKHGDDDNIWGQEPGRGAFTRAGTWDPSFSWSNVLTTNSLLFTWEGYGGHHEPGQFTSIDTAVSNKELFVTGVWLVDTVTASSNGMMSLHCRDVGRLLLDLIVFPPVIPEGLYPLEYYPAGKTAFESQWGPRGKGRIPLGSRGEIRLNYHSSSLDTATGSTNTSIDGHRPSHAIDGDWKSFALSNGHSGPVVSGSEWFQYSFTQKLSSLTLKAWAGGYVCYVSVSIGGVWQGTETVPGSGINYVAKVGVPMSIPDNTEPVIGIDLNQGFDSNGMPNSFNPGAGTGYVRLSFQELYYSPYDSPGAGNYRAGIRDLIAYQTGEPVPPLTSDYNNMPWTFAMTHHPTRGYWIVDAGGKVHGFGDAADYDSNSFADISMAPNAWFPEFNYTAVGIAGQKDGKGYWVVDQTGKVHARGSASHYGEYDRVASGEIHFSTDPRIPPRCIACGITATYTGEGYWVIYTDGLVRGFGDADPATVWLPSTDVVNYMAALNHNSSPGLTATRYRQFHKGAGIAGHPTKMGYWAVNKSGEVFAEGEADHYGQMVNRTYNLGSADSFKMEISHAVSDIESTKDGDGYWISVGSGKIASFGKAREMGPIDIYADNPVAGLDPNPEFMSVPEAFRAIVWAIARDPDGSGFWVLTASGDVGAYDAEFWGKPGYDGLTGYRWHEGNFDGEWSNIIKEILLWGGFLFYDPNVTSSDTPALYGNLESTGIQTEQVITAEKWDKSTLMDVIREISETVAYSFRISEDGRAIWESPNFWSAGNFDQDGVRIYVTYDEDGIPTRVESGGEPFIPVIHEQVDLFDYSATLNSDSLRSEIIVGTDAPSQDDPTSTGFVRKVPSNVAALRGIDKPMMLLSPLIENEEEMHIMAELIAIRIWFNERAGQITCVADPTLSVNDQIRIVERNTNETYIHIINGISSNNNLDEGSWDFTLRTNWLGDEDNWVITANPDADDNEYVKISERVDKWQAITGRELPTSGQAVGGEPEMTTMFGQFSSSIVVLPYDFTGSVDIEDPDPEQIPGNVSGGAYSWTFEGEITLNRHVIIPEITTEVLSTPLGNWEDAWIEVSTGGGGILTNQQLLNPGGTIQLPSMGTDGQSTTYSFKVTGIPAKVGSGTLRLKFSGLGIRSSAASGTVVVVGGQ